MSGDHRDAPVFSVVLVAVGSSLLALACCGGLALVWRWLA